MHVGYLNLNKYGGAVPKTNDLVASLVQIRGGLAFAGTGPAAGDPPGTTSQTVLVAGFGEVMNGVGAVPGVQTLTQQFTNDAGASSMALLAGISAAGLVEYIGVGVHSAAKIVGYGRIVLDASADPPAMRDTFVATNVLPANPGANLPNFMPSADVRGVVYVVVTHAGQAFAVGFVHNVYTLPQRFAFAERVPQMMAILEQQADAATGPGTTGRVVLGGDWNVDDAVRESRVLNSIWVPAFASMWPAVKPGTTQGGSRYDYWYEKLPNSVPAAWADPLRLPGPPPGPLGYPTDHAAITIEI